MLTGVNFEKAIDYYKKGKEVIVLDRNSLGKNEKSGYDTFSFSELGKNLDFLVDVPAVPNPEFEQAVQDMVEPDQNENDAEGDEQLPPPDQPEKKLEKETVATPGKMSREEKSKIIGIFQGTFKRTAETIAAWIPLPEPYKEGEDE